MKALIVIAGLCLFCTGMNAASVYQFSLDTSSLMLPGNAAQGPFCLEFLYNEGSGDPDSDNTVTLSNFNFGGGGPVAGTAALFGGASGSLETQITITDSEFWNAYTQPFNPGTVLSFRIDLTNNIDAGPDFVPDYFVFAILDGPGNEIPTQSLNELGWSAFLTIQADPAGPIATSYSGTSLGLGAPSLTEGPGGTATPEPGSILLLAGGLIALSVVVRRRAGGVLLAPPRSFAGPHAEHLFNTLYADHVFLGADGIDAEAGPSKLENDSER